MTACQVEKTQREGLEGITQHSFGKLEVISHSAYPSPAAFPVSPHVLLLSQLKII